MDGVERAASALFGYCVGSLVVVPFDRVKTLLQAQPVVNRRAVAVATEVARQAGLRGLYRGLDAQLLIAPFAVFYYSVYDELLTLQGDDPFAPLYAAALARTLEVTLRMPLELLRTQLQAAPGSLTLLGLVREQRGGALRAWSRGYVPTLARDVPFSVLYWFAYEQAKTKVVVSDTWVPNAAFRTFVHSFICGGLAGTLAAFITTPVDVMKTLRQKAHDGGGLKPASSSLSDITRFLIAHPSATFAGAGPRCLRIPMGLATMMAGIETAKWGFSQRQESTDRGS